MAAGAYPDHFFTEYNGVTARSSSAFGVLVVDNVKREAVIYTIELKKPFNYGSFV